MALKLYSQVKVVRLIQAPEDYDGWKLNQRNPEVGDTGTYIELLEAPGIPSKYVVEMADPNSPNSIWLSDFHEEEIQLVSNDE